VKPDNCISVELTSSIPEDKTRFNLLLPKELNHEFRDYVLRKYNGYHRGAFTKEFELAIRNLVEKESVA
jgi:hypothetical protein